MNVYVFVTNAPNNLECLHLGVLYSLVKCLGARPGSLRSSTRVATIKIGCKVLLGANTLAYLSGTSVKIKKVFFALTPVWQLRREAEQLGRGGADQAENLRVRHWLWQPGEGSGGAQGLLPAGNEAQGSAEQDSRNRWQNQVTIRKTFFSLSLAIAEKARVFFLEKFSYCGLYYKHIFTILSDNCKWCLYYKCFISLCLSLGLCRQLW